MIWRADQENDLSHNCDSDTTTKGRHEEHEKIAKHKREDKETPSARRRVQQRSQPFRVFRVLRGCYCLAVSESQSQKIAEGASGLVGLE